MIHEWASPWLVIVLLVLAVTVGGVIIKSCNWTRPMPTITVTREMLDALGVSVADLQGLTLTGPAKRSLEAMLAPRGFDVTGDIEAVVLPSGGVVLSQ
jgi:5-enolpyruvylshikimate-3-phosphate synthase